jgi:hypothetical protein
VVLASCVYDSGYREVLSSLRLKCLRAGFSIAFLLTNINWRGTAARVARGFKKVKWSTADPTRVAWCGARQAQRSTIRNQMLLERAFFDESNR